MALNAFVLIYDLFVSAICIFSRINGKIYIESKYHGITSDTSLGKLLKHFMNEEIVSSLQEYSPCAWNHRTVYPKKYAHGFCFAVFCCGYTLTDFPISIRLTSLALWQSSDCPSASKATLMNTDKYFIWIHYERLHNHNKAKHNKTVCIFLGIYCILIWQVYASCVFYTQRAAIIHAIPSHILTQLVNTRDLI